MNSGCNAVNGCTHTGNSLTCNDGNACTTNDKCKPASGTCSGTVNCDDNNACTTDSCTSAQAGCAHTVVADGTSCSSSSKICVAGVCKNQVCGDGIKSGSEICDDGNNVSNDGCTNCKIDGCADGYRNGNSNMSYANSPKVAFCSGEWYGSISSSNGFFAAGTLCGSGWHVCSSGAADQALM